jgi:hypothetical protein
MHKKWAAYEDAARSVIAGMREAINLATGGEVQRGEGASGMQWELDAKAWQEGTNGFLLVEVRQYDSPLNQEALAVIAWCIHGAAGSGRVVASSLLREECSSPVTNTADTEYLRLTDDSTAQNYIAEFLSRRFRDLTATGNL